MPEKFPVPLEGFILDPQAKQFPTFSRHVTESISLSLSILFGTEQVTSGKECYRKIWKDTE